MKDSEVKTILNFLKTTGFYIQDERKVKSSFEINSPDKAKSIEKIKSFEANKGSALSNEELFDLYQIIANLHDFDNNSEKKILYQLRSIKYKPSDLEIRFRYLNNFWNYLLNNRSNIGKGERDILKKEFNKFREYAYMEWGRDSDLYTKCLMILEELDAPHPDESSNEVKDFIEEWKRGNRMYRPDGQALDYASQVIYEQVTN